MLRSEEFKEDNRWLKQLDKKLAAVLSFWVFVSGGELEFDIYPPVSYKSLQELVGKNLQTFTRQTNQPLYF